MTRVLHLIGRDTPLDMLNQLAALAEPHDRIVSVGPLPAWEDRFAPKFVHMPLGLPALSGRGLWRLVRDADVVHAWSSIPHQTAVSALRNRAMGLVRSLPAAPSGRSLRRLQWIERRRGAHWTVPTDNARQQLLSAGMAADRVWLVPPVAEAPPADRPDQHQLRAEMGLADDELALVAAGEINRPASHRTACWIHAMLRYVEPTIRLILPDNGPMESSVRSFASGAGFSDEILGPWSPSKRLEIVGTCNVALFVPSEDCGVTAFVSAMAAGLPVAAFKTPDLAECGGQAVHFAHSATPRAGAQAALSVIESPDLRARLAEAAQRRVAELFSIDRARQAVAETYAAAEPVS